VPELLKRTTSRELSEWMLYEGMEPFGEKRADLRAGIVASTIYNLLKGEKAKALAPEDFMPRFEPGTAEGAQEEAQTSRLVDLAQALGAKVVKRGDS